MSGIRVDKHAIKDVDQVGAMKQRESEQQVWKEFDGKSDPNFFSDITIAKDGGFSEVKELWYNMRWFTAAITIFFLLSNIYYTLYVDIDIIRKSGSEEDRTNLILQSLAEFILDKLGLKGKLFFPEVVPGGKLVAGIELLLTTWRIFQTFYHLVMSRFGRDEQTRWFAAEVVWWVLIPDLYTYSAMRLLHYVSPQVLVADLSAVLKSETAWKSLFIIHRLACLTIGFDAFLLKCRESRDFLSDESISLGSIWAGLIFLKQVLGIVQLGMFVRDRLFIFIFAGEDGVMQRREASLQRVWNAMLVREIWRTFSRSKAVAILLSFDDNDFQKLVLNDRVKLGAKATEFDKLSDDSSSGSDEDTDTA